MFRTSDKSAKDSRIKDLNEAKAETHEVEWPLGGGKTEVARNLITTRLNSTFHGSHGGEGGTGHQAGRSRRARKDAQDKLNDYVKKSLPGMSVGGLEGLRNGMRTFKVDLRQINVNPSGTMINYLGGIGLVDRCQSCHIAMDPLVVPVTMTLTKADLGMAKSHDAPFTTHPDPELIQWHPLRAIWLLALPRRQWTRAGYGRRRPMAATSTGSGR